MKATGIVRRIDELGRVVIPKEIRRTMRIREGDPLEIFIDNKNEVVFKKYSMIGELSGIANQFSEILNNISPLPVCITDTEQVIAVAGLSKKEYVGRRISHELDKTLLDRNIFIEKNDGGKQIEIADGLTRPAAVIVPIMTGGDVIGSVIYLTSEEGATATDAEIKLARSAAEFMGRQTEI